VLLSIVSNLLLLTGPLFMLQIYDRVLASKSVPTLVALTGLMVVLYGFYAFLELLRTRMAIRFSTLVAVRYATPLFALVIGRGPGNRATAIRCAISIRSDPSFRARDRWRFSTCPGCRFIWRSFSCSTPCSAGWPLREPWR